MRQSKNHLRLNEHHQKREINNIYHFILWFNLDIKSISEFKATSKHIANEIFSYVEIWTSDENAIAKLQNVSRWLWHWHEIDYIWFALFRK